MEQLSLTEIKPTEQTAQALPAIPQPAQTPQSTPTSKATPAPKPKAEPPKILTVSDLNRAIKGTLEGGFALVWLKAEISNFKPHSSGHWYFSLKDAKAQISGVMFKGFNQSVRFKPTDGMEVLLRGKITVYEPRGNYQIFCELMEPVGAGALQLAFEQLKAKLSAEGLFAAERKRQLPAFPLHLGVVTSPTGAAVRDILKVLHRRFRGLRVTLIPAVVQGTQAPASIITALKLASQITDIDVMIVGRGGGSIEDLCCFNDESVVRAIAQFRVPIISAVGHEIDFTIADFVADVRAPTPSAAAEMVVQSAAELIDRLRARQLHFNRILGHQLQISRRRLTHIQSRLVDPKRRLMDLAQRCDELQCRLQLAIEGALREQTQHVLLLKEKIGTPLTTVTTLRHQVGEAALKMEGVIELDMERRRGRLATLAAGLEPLSPLGVLDRGYAIATHQGKVIRDPTAVKAGDTIEVRVSRGKIQAQVQAIEIKKA
jgi:exodeoxyribonuclease VII large subunit